MRPAAIPQEHSLYSHDDGEGRIGVPIPGDLPSREMILDDETDGDEETEDGNNDDEFDESFGDDDELDEDGLDEDFDDDDGDFDDLEGRLSGEMTGSSVLAR